MSLGYILLVYLKYQLMLKKLEEKANVFNLKKVLSSSQIKAQPIVMGKTRKSEPGQLVMFVFLVRI